MAKILVCEDDRPLREVYDTVLTAGGHTVDVAENGRQGLKKCRVMRYDLILLDLMMPEVDGVEFLRLSKVTKKSPSTRVIILSNLSSGRDIEEALALGADQHVLKSSLTPKDLIELVEGILCVGIKD
jgi:CheY-like chemotaxis protein